MRGRLVSVNQIPIGFFGRSPWFALGIVIGEKEPPPANSIVVL
jgi:hypothetical protein